MAEKRAKEWGTSPIRKISVFRFKDGVHWLQIFRGKASRTYVVSEEQARAARRITAGWATWGWHASPKGVIR